MQDVSALAATAAALSVGVVSPGPSFVLVARTSIASSRSEGVAAAFGMGTGGLSFAVAALLGLHGLLLAVPAVYLGLKVAGGLYLAYLGIQIWRGSRQELAVLVASADFRSDTMMRAFRLGLTTQLSNPKTAIVYASVFAAFMPEQPTTAFIVALALTAFAIETGWYCLVAVVLSAERPRQAYLRFKSGVDRLAGGVMVALGLRLVASAIRP